MRTAGMMLVGFFIGCGTSETIHDEPFASGNEIALDSKPIVHSNSKTEAVTPEGDADQVAKVIKSSRYFLAYKLSMRTSPGTKFSHLVRAIQKDMARLLEEWQSGNFEKVRKELAFNQRRRELILSNSIDMATVPQEFKTLVVEHLDAVHEVLISNM